MRILTLGGIGVSSMDVLKVLSRLTNLFYMQLGVFSPNRQAKVLSPQWLPTLSVIAPSIGQQNPTPIKAAS